MLPGLQGPSRPVADRVTTRGHHHVHAVALEADADSIKVLRSGVFVSRGRAQWTRVAHKDLRFALGETPPDEMPQFRSLRASGRLGRAGGAILEFVGALAKASELICESESISRHHDDARRRGAGTQF